MVAKKLSVAVLMGGRSDEHDVSRASGWAVLTQLPGDGFEAWPVVLGRDGRWRFPSLEGADPEAEVDPELTRDPGLALPEGIRRLLDRAPDVVFIAMHGPEGEDGKIQSLLDLLDLPYVGSDAYASSLAMNKPLTKAVYRAFDIPVADDQILRRVDWERDPAAVEAALRQRFAPPWVLKTPKLGSSVGLTIVGEDGDLTHELSRLFALDPDVLAEEFVAGRELTCGVVDTPALGPTRSLPILEITPVESPFFDYHAKYTPGAAQEICPAPVDDSVRDRVQTLGLAAHQVLGCRSMSRTDFILTPDGALVTLETNTIPGLTRTSLLPQQAAAAGLTFADLVAGLTRGAYESARGVGMTTG
jgi:D-alanine-D-alanine ligase